MKDRKNYILILPSLFTTGNLFCGFYSILSAFNQEYEKSAYAILIAGIFDILDGRVARMTKSQSVFGMEYDSISDVVSFGIAPAVLSYTWVLVDFGNLGWAVAFFFAACGALRLARFNTVGHLLPKSYFIGLPIPAAATMFAASVIAYHDLNLIYPNFIVPILMVLLGLLMVSTIRYRSFKDFDFKHRRGFFELVFLVALLALIMVKPEITIGIVIGYYVVWGPAREFASWLRSRGKAATLTEQRDQT